MRHTREEIKHAHIHHWFDSLVKEFEVGVKLGKVIMSFILNLSTLK